MDFSKATLRARLLRTIAGMLATVLIIQAAGIPLAEASQVSLRSRNTQLAALPPVVSAPITALPSLLPAAKPVLPSDRFATRIASPELAAILKALPRNRVSIRSVRPGIAGVPAVVVIQDVHQNPEAQLNIAGALQSLFDANAVGLVGVEGAFGPFDFTPFHAFHRPAEVAEVSRTFVEGNLMGGPSYAGITAPRAPPFVGADDETAYRRNVAAYLRASSQTQIAASKIESARKDLETEKELSLSASARPFDRARTAYESGELSFADYVERLYALQNGGGDAPADPNLTIERFIEARRLERSLDFTAVESEQHRALEILTRNITGDEVKELLAESVAYHSGQIGFGDFYSYIKALCERKKVPMAQVPEFNRYLQYVLLADGIQADELFSAVRAREEQVMNRVATNARDLALLRKSRYLWLSSKLTRFELTPDEWAEYRRLQTSLGDHDRGLADFEDFYREADVRSERMASLLLDSKAGAVAIVAGGFHTPRLTRRLAEKKASIIVVAPKITKADKGTAYLSVFAREKTPLDRLFAGERLFINPEVTTVGAAGASRPYAAALLACITVTLVAAGITIATTTGITVDPQIVRGLYQVRMALPEGSVRLFVGVGAALTAAWALAPSVSTAGFKVWTENPSRASLIPPPVRNIFNFLSRLRRGEAGVRRPLIVALGVASVALMIVSLDMAAGTGGLASMAMMGFVVRDLRATRTAALPIVHETPAGDSVAPVTPAAPSTPDLTPRDNGGVTTAAVLPAENAPGVAFRLAMNRAPTTRSDRWESAILDNVSRPARVISLSRSAIASGQATADSIEVLLYRYLEVVTDEQYAAIQTAWREALADAIDSREQYLALAIPALQMGWLGVGDLEDMALAASETPEADPSLLWWTDQAVKTARTYRFGAVSSSWIDAPVSDEPPTDAAAPPENAVDRSDSVAPARGVPLVVSIIFFPLWFPFSILGSLARASRAWRVRGAGAALVGLLFVPMDGEKAEKPAADEIGPPGIVHRLKEGEINGVAEPAPREVPRVVLPVRAVQPEVDAFAALAKAEQDDAAAKAAAEKKAADDAEAARQAEIRKEAERKAAQRATLSESLRAADQRVDAARRKLSAASDEFHFDYRKMGDPKDKTIAAYERYEASIDAQFKANAHIPAFQDHIYWHTGVTLLQDKKGGWYSAVLSPMVVIKGAYVYRDGHYYIKSDLTAKQQKELLIDKNYLGKEIRIGRKGIEILRGLHLGVDPRMLDPRNARGAIGGTVDGGTVKMYTRSYLANVRADPENKGGWVIINPLTGERQKFLPTFEGMALLAQTAPLLAELEAAESNRSGVIAMFEALDGKPADAPAQPTVEGQAGVPSKIASVAPTADELKNKDVRDAWEHVQRAENSALASALLIDNRLSPFAIKGRGTIHLLGSDAIARVIPNAALRNQLLSGQYNCVMVTSDGETGRIKYIFAQERLTPEQAKGRDTVANPRTEEVYSASVVKIDVKTGRIERDPYYQLYGSGFHSSVVPLVVQKVRIDLDEPKESLAYLKYVKIEKHGENYYGWVPYGSAGAEPVIDTRVWTPKGDLSKADVPTLPDDGALGRIVGMGREQFTYNNFVISRIFLRQNVTDSVDYGMLAERVMREIRPIGIPEVMAARQVLGTIDRTTARGRAIYDRLTNAWNLYQNLLEEWGYGVDSPQVRRVRLLSNALRDETIDIAALHKQLTSIRTTELPESFDVFYHGESVPRVTYRTVYARTFGPDPLFYLDNPAPPFKSNAPKTPLPPDAVIPQFEKRTLPVHRPRLPGLTPLWSAGAESYMVYLNQRMELAGDYPSEFAIGEGRLYKKGPSHPNSVALGLYLDEVQKREPDVRGLHLKILDELGYRRGSRAARAVEQNPISDFYGKQHPTMVTHQAFVDAVKSGKDAREVHAAVLARVAGKNSELSQFDRAFLDELYSEHPKMRALHAVLLGFDRAVDSPIPAMRQASPEDMKKLRDKMHPDVAKLYFGMRAVYGENNPMVKRMALGYRADYGSDSRVVRSAEFVTQTTASDLAGWDAIRRLPVEAGHPLASPKDAETTTATYERVNVDYQNSLKLLQGRAYEYQRLAAAATLEADRDRYDADALAAIDTYRHAAQRMTASDEKTYVRALAPGVVAARADLEKEKRGKDAQKLPKTEQNTKRTPLLGEGRTDSRFNTWLVLQKGKTQFGMEIQDFTGKNISATMSGTVRVGGTELKDLKLPADGTTRPWPIALDAPIEGSFKYHAREYGTRGELVAIRTYAVTIGKDDKVTIDGYHDWVRKKIWKGDFRVRRTVTPTDRPDVFRVTTAEGRSWLDRYPGADASPEDMVLERTYPDGRREVFSDQVFNETTGEWKAGATRVFRGDVPTERHEFRVLGNGESETKVFVLTPERGLDGKVTYKERLRNVDFRDGQGDLLRRVEEFTMWEIGVAKGPVPHETTTEFDPARSQKFANDYGIEGQEFPTAAKNKAGETLRVYNVRITDERVGERTLPVVTVNVKMQGPQGPNAASELAKLPEPIQLKVRVGYTSTYRVITVGEGANADTRLRRVRLEDAKGDFSEFRYEIPNPYGIASWAASTHKGEIEPYQVTVPSDAKGRPLVDVATGRPQTPMPEIRPDADGRFRFDEYVRRAKGFEPHLTRYMNEYGEFVREAGTGFFATHSEFTPDPFTQFMSPQKTVNIEGTPENPVRGSIIRTYFDPESWASISVDTPIENKDLPRPPEEKKDGDKGAGLPPIPRAVANAEVPGIGGMSGQAVLLLAATLVAAVEEQTAEPTAAETIDFDQLLSSPLDVQKQQIIALAATPHPLGVGDIDGADATGVFQGDLSEAISQQVGEQVRRGSMGRIDGQSILVNAAEALHEQMTGEANTGLRASSLGALVRQAAIQADLEFVVRFATEGDAATKIRYSLRRADDAGAKRLKQVAVVKDEEKAALAQAFAADIDAGRLLILGVSEAGSVKIILAAIQNARMAGPADLKNAQFSFLVPGSMDPRAILTDIADLGLEARVYYVTNAINAVLLEVTLDKIESITKAFRLVQQQA